MNSKSPRLLTLLTSTALLLAALAAAAPGAPAAPKKCPQGKTAWKLEGRSTCLPSPVAASKGAAGPAMAELWLREASRPMPAGKLRLSPALRHALPRAGALLADEISGAGGGASASASGDSRGPVVERVDQVIGEKDLGNGVVAEGRVKGRVFEDDSVDLEVEFEMRDRNGNSVLFSPDFESLFAKDAAVGCPTAAGVVTADSKGQVGGTVIRRKGKRVIASRTVSQGWQIRARGQVGTDARLHSVAADISLSMKKFERGLQLETSFATAATVSREGAPKAAGTPTADVKVRAAGASHQEERAYELEAARLLASSPELAGSVAGVADISRDRLLEAEPTWYDLPNECAQLTWEPGAGITLEPNETRRLTGTVIAKRDGGQASGRIEIGAVSPGRLVPVTPAFSAAAPASFIATGGEPNAGGLSVQAAAVATSTAGRAQATWSAHATPVKLPERFVGTIASTKSTAGLTRSFHGSATFTRTSVMRGPDGSINAWYELTAATLGGAKEILGPPSGCRLEANGTNGQIESGDLELRVLPNGEAVYALLYDLKVPSQFLPTDCPPPGPSGFDGEISVFLNSRKPGPVASQMRPMGGDFVIQENGVGDVTDLAGLTTTASWTLVPG
jgi:hypothetical protein